MTTNGNTIKDEILDKMTEEEMRCLVELLLGRSHIDGKISCKQIISNNKDRVRHIKSVELNLLIVTESLINIELENKMNSIKELVMRSRYYSAMITSEYGLKTKQRYEELKPVIIMFIVAKKFQENNKSLVVLPEVISKEYYDSGERFIFLSTTNLRSALSGRNYKKLVDVLKPQSNDYSMFWKK